MLGSLIIEMVDSVIYTDSFNHDRVETWNYRSKLEKLNFLVNNTCPDICMAVYQCAHFCSNLKPFMDLQFSGLLITY